MTAPLAFARQGLTDEIANEATNNDVFPEFGNLGIQQVANRHIGILDEALLEETNTAVEFLEFAVHDFVRNVRRLALYLCLVDVAFCLDQIARHIGTVDVERMRGGDMQGDILHELSEILVSRHEISLAIHLYEHTNLALKMNVGGDDALFCCTCSLFRGTGDAFRAQNRFGLFQVATALDESPLAIHKSGVGLFTELLNKFWIDFSCCVH